MECKGGKNSPRAIAACAQNSNASPKQLLLVFLMIFFRWLSMVCLLTNKAIAIRRCKPGKNPGRKTFITHRNKKVRPARQRFLQAAGSAKGLTGRSRPARLPTSNVNKIQIHIEGELVLQPNPVNYPIFGGYFFWQLHI